MKTFLPTLLVSLSVFGFFVLALGFKSLFDKKAEFRGGCASNNPMLRNEIGECTACGKKIDDSEVCELPSDSSLPKIG